jgi:hypothetical protein
MVMGVLTSKVSMCCLMWSGRYREVCTCGSSGALRNASTVEKINVSGIKLFLNLAQ